MEKLEVDLDCPKCKHVFKFKIADMSPGKSATCPKCGAVIKFTGDDLSKFQKSLDDFDRNLKNLFK